MNDELSALRTWLVAKGGVSPEDVSVFTSLLTKKVGESGEYLSHEGDARPVVAYVFKGALKGYYSNPHGKEFVKDFYTEGEIAANYAEAITSVPVRLSLKFIEPSIVYQMDAEAFRRLFEKNPAWGNVGRILAEKYFLNRDARERLLMLEDAKGRYLAFLEQNAPMVQRIKDYDLASYLGIDPSTLSRLKKSIVAEGNA